MTPSGNHDLAPIVASGLPWAVDNDHFWRPDPPAFRRLLAKVAGHPGCRFVACPDVVGDARATLAAFDAWESEVRASGQPVALVGQDGAEALDLPWGRIDALFVGGSTAWKESGAALSLTEEAKALGKWVHVGRVNTYRRLRKVHDWGTVDSVDGTCFSKWPDKYFPWFIRKLGQLQAQAVLWG